MTDPATLASIGKVLGEYPQVAAAWVFGSVARGTATPASDLDIALLLACDEAELSSAELYGMTSRLERMSPSGVVDLVLLGPQGAVFRHAVLSEGVLVHEGDRSARLEFEERAARDYFDWKPTHDIAMRSTFEGLRRRFGADGTTEPT